MSIHNDLSYRTYSFIGGWKDPESLTDIDKGVRELLKYERDI